MEFGWHKAQFDAVTVLAGHLEPWNGSRRKALDRPGDELSDLWGPYHPRPVPAPPLKIPDITIVLG